MTRRDDDASHASGKELRRGSASRDDQLNRPAPDGAGGRGAAHGERSPERINHRNGYRDRAWETRAGTVGLHIPNLRKGSYFHRDGLAAVKPLTGTRSG